MCLCCRRKELLLTPWAGFKCPVQNYKTSTLGEGICGECIEARSTGNSKGLCLSPGHKALVCNRSKRGYKWTAWGGRK